MTDPQELANRIGAAQRATEDALNAGDAATALAKAQEQHQNLTDGFAYLRDELGLKLDWGQVAGNGGGSSAKGVHTNSGGYKTPPPASE